MKQRNLALDWLYNASTSVGHRMNAVVYFADDDNAYDVRLFDDYVRNVSGIGVWAVGFSGGVKVETPVVKNGTVTGWDTHYAPKRPFAVDMAGFAVHLRLLLSKRHHFLEKWGKGHFETCFLEQLGVRRVDVVPFGFDAKRRKELSSGTPRPVPVRAPAAPTKDSRYEAECTPPCSFAPGSVYTSTVTLHSRYAVRRLIMKNLPSWAHQKQCVARWKMLTDFRPPSYSLAVT